GEADHGVPVDGRGDPLRRLVRRRPGGNEEDPGEGEALPERLREDEGADGDRVGRAAKDTEADLPPAPPHSRNWPGPRTTNFVVVSSSTPTGPRAWSFEVEMPSSAPMPNW